jgi:hypothetical protein
MPMPTAPLSVTGPVYVLCEGPADGAFINMLISENALTGFEVGFPSETGHYGKGGFSRHLTAILGGSGSSNIKTLLVIADNEDNPAKSLKECKAALREAGNYDVPDPPERLESDRIVAIHMIPDLNNSGALEHVLLDAWLDIDPDAQKCIEAFSQCTKDALTWKSNPRAKFQLQALLSSRCVDNPCLPVRFLWSAQNWKQAKNPVPRNSSRYEPIISFLRSFQG